MAAKVLADNSVLQRILKLNFTQSEAVAECKRNSLGVAFQFEMEKLRLYMEFVNRLPRDYKESFKFIDHKAMSKIIEVENSIKGRPP